MGLAVTGVVFNGLFKQRDGFGLAALSGVGVR